MASKSKVRRLILFGALLAAALAAGFFLRRGSGASEPKYRTATVDRGDITMTVTATGSISAVTTVKVGSQVSGIISRLHADFNSRVKQGQLIAELDPSPFEAQVEQRRADLVQAEVQARNTEIGHRRQGRLLAEGLSSQADFDAAQANFDAARAQVDQARAGLRQAQSNLTNTRIVSPIDGVVVDRQYDVGQTVAASFQAPTLFTIAQDLTKMQVQADVDQSDIGRIHVGQTARFTVDAYPEQVFSGRIAQVRLNATVNQNVITYPVIAEVANPDERLRPNMTADVTIEVERIGDVLRVPNAALRFRPPEEPAGSGPAAGPSPAAAGERAFERPGPGTRSGRGSPAGAARQMLDDAVGQKARRLQTVYRLLESERLRPVAIQTGISDGRFTAVTGGPLGEGERIVVGLATSKVENSGTFPRGMRGF